MFAVVLASAAAMWSVPQPAIAADAQPSTIYKGTFIVQLPKALDSKKLKAGDTVDATLTADVTVPGGTRIPQGSKLVGHVTQASRDQGKAVLAIAFDRLVPSQGKAMPIDAVILAAAPNPDQQVSTSTMPTAYAGLNASTEAGVESVNSNKAVPVLDQDSRGALGMKNVELTKGGTFTSTGKQVKLDTGTRLLVQATWK